MPAPKKPNTAAATAAVRRRGDETAAARLRAHGWTVIPPEQATATRDVDDVHNEETVEAVTTYQSGRWCPTCDEPVTGWKMLSEPLPPPRPGRRYERVKPARLVFEPCGHPVPDSFDRRQSAAFRLGEA